MASGCPPKIAKLIVGLIKKRPGILGAFQLAFNGQSFPGCRHCFNKGKVARRRFNLVQGEGMWSGPFVAWEECKICEGTGFHA